MEVMGWILVALLLCLVLAILTYLKQSQNVSASGLNLRSNFKVDLRFIPNVYIFYQERKDGGRRRLWLEVLEAGERAAE